MCILLQRDSSTVLLASSYYYVLKYNTKQTDYTQSIAARTRPFGVGGLEKENRQKTQLFNLVQTCLIIII
jgi:hypothetical protein